MAGTYYRFGDYNVICDRTGFKVKASQTQKEWNNLRVIRRVWEIRHPQDYLKSFTDKQAVPDARTEAANVFLAVGDVTPGDL